MKLNPIEKVAYILLVIGGINWGLVGWVDYNLVDEIFGVGSTASRVIYAVVGVAAVYVIYSLAMMMSQEK
ncbi:MAG TPA: DUF378 domain-containing protein [Candidatus Saccharimonadales bacterium]|nr:DUF378 domain-containing protein [Candidatus Saccharimonadales bacterium]